MARFFAHVEMCFPAKRVVDVNVCMKLISLSSFFCLFFKADAFFFVKLKNFHQCSRLFKSILIIVVARKRHNLYSDCVFSLGIRDVSNHMSIKFSSDETPACKKSQILPFTPLDEINFSERDITFLAFHIYSQHKTHQENTNEQGGVGCTFCDTLRLQSQHLPSLKKSSTFLLPLSLFSSKYDIKHSCL